MAKFEYDIPERTLDGIRRYVDQHIVPGGFVLAVLRNELTEAVCRADLDNLLCLRDIVKYLSNEVPAICWGSPGAVRVWLKAKE